MNKKKLKEMNKKIFLEYIEFFIFEYLLFLFNIIFNLFIFCVIIIAMYETKITGLGILLLIMPLYNIITIPMYLLINRKKFKEKIKKIENEFKKK